MGQEELDTGELTIGCSIHERCALIIISDIDVQFMCDECLHHILVSSLSTDMKSCVPSAVPAGDLGAVTDVLDDIFIVPGLGCLYQLLIELLLPPLPLRVISLGLPSLLSILGVRHCHNTP